jgi:hypothetical protein
VDGFVSRPGRCSSYTVSVASRIPMAGYGGPGQLMAQKRDGRKAATATYVARQKLMP